MNVTHRPKNLLRLTPVLFAFFLTSWAQAQTVSEESSRVRVGIAGGLVLGRASGATDRDDVYAGVFTPNLIFDLGVQSNRHFALYMHLMAGSLIFSSHAGAYAVAEYTPVRWFSVGTGVGYEGYHLGFWSCSGCGNERPERNSWSGIAVPVIAAFNFGGAEGWNTGQRRSALRLALEGAAGMEPLTGVWGGRGVLSFGAAWM